MPSGIKQKYYFGIVNEMLSVLYFSELFEIIVMYFLLATTCVSFVAYLPLLTEDFKFLYAIHSLYQEKLFSIRESCGVLNLNRYA